MKTRPWKLLPLRAPDKFDPGPEWFYKNIALPLSKDYIKLMNAGLHIDQNAVDNLREILDDVLSKVKQNLIDNPVIQAFQEHQYPKKYEAYKAEVTKSCRTIDYYIKDFNASNMVHRTIVMNTYLDTKKIDYKDKWSIKELKAFNKYAEDSFVDELINKTLPATNMYAKKGMKILAQSKVDIWNKARYTKVEEVSRETILPPFNPGSSKQLQELFEYLKVEPLVLSKKTNLPSWGRGQIEQIFETAPTEWKGFLQDFIDYSFSSIVRSTFIEGFDKFCINDVLRGNFKNFGAKSYRP